MGPPSFPSSPTTLTAWGQWHILGLAPQLPPPAPLPELSASPACIPVCMPTWCSSRKLTATPPPSLPSKVAPSRTGSATGHRFECNGPPPVEGPARPPEAWPSWSASARWSRMVATSPWTSSCLAVAGALRTYSCRGWATRCMLPPSISPTMPLAGVTSSQDASQRWRIARRPTPPGSPSPPWPRR